MEKQMEEFDVLNIRNGELALNPEEAFEKQASLIKGDPRFGVKSFLETIKIVEEEEEEEEPPAFERAVERHFAGAKEEGQLVKLDQALQRDRLTIQKEAKTNSHIDTDRELRLLK